MRITRVNSRLFSTGNTDEDTNPAFSPSGQQIAFQSYRNNEWGIYIMNNDGTNETPLVTNNALEPDWYTYSPDMVFARGAELYKVNTSGAPVETQLTNHASGESHNPAISSDGNWILYDHDGSLYVVDANCAGLCTSDMVATVGIHAFPAWSLDGTQMNLVRGRHYLRWINLALRQ